MMGEEEKSIYISGDLVEEIFLGLPLKSIVRFKSVSKQWRSILESESFAERRMKLPKKRKILAAHNCNCGDPPSLLPESKMVGDEEIVYLHCDATKPSMSCDGLVCFPGPDWINVVNPSTGQVRRFLSELDPTFPDGNWVFGFGKDRVTGSYKVVKMCVRTEPEEKQSHVLDVERGGEWKKLRSLPPPFVNGLGRESVCVNGSIYWLLQVATPADYRILALDLHTQEFHHVSVPATLLMPETQVVNLQDRLAVTNNRQVWDSWILEISTMNNAQEEIWSLTYSIDLAGPLLFKPVAVSKQGNLVLCNNQGKSLYKYYPETCEAQCLSSDICVISGYLENLVPLGHDPSPIRTCTNRRLYFKFGIQELVYTALLLVIAACGLVSLQELLTRTHKWWQEEIYSNEILVLIFFACVITYLF